jgi:hypothetical protein
MKSVFAPIAELDGNEIGYLVAKVAEIKRRLTA